MNIAATCVRSLYALAWGLFISRWVAAALGNAEFGDRVCPHGIVVPTSFNSVTENELSAHGVNICIYANQLTRAAFPAMQSVAQDLLKYHRAQEVDSRLMPFKKIITLIDG